MEVVKELALLIEWFGDKEGFNIDVDAFDLSIPVSALVPNCQLDDFSTAFKLIWRDRKIEQVLFDPEDGIPDYQNMLSSIKEKCERKKTIGSVVKIVFGEICGNAVTPVPSNPSTPDYLLRAKKTATPDSHDGSSSSSGSGIPIYYNRLDEDYLKIERLGEGGSGDVDRYIHKLSGMEQAVKIVSLENTMNDKDPLVEVKALCGAQHENVVKFYDAWIHKETYRPDPQSRETKVYKMLLISMEYCPSTLAKELEKCWNEHKEFSTNELENIFLGIAKGLSYVHEKGIVHGDISPDNIFIGKEGGIKIGDFGSVIILPLGERTFKLKIGKGKPLYRAPEVKVDEGVVDNKIDIFSFGIVMYYLMNPLLDLKENQDAIREARAGKIPKSLGSSRLGKEVASLLHVDPDKRPSAAEVASLFAVDTPSGAGATESKTE